MKLIQAITATTATQAPTVHHMPSAAATRSAACVTSPVQLALDLVRANARAVMVAGGCTTAFLAATAKIAVAPQIALWQTPTAACRTMYAISAIHPVLPAADPVPAAVQAASQGRE